MMEWYLCRFHSLLFKHYAKWTKFREKERIEMEKELSELSLEELWRLFPIILKESQPHYKNWYEAEKYEIFQNIDREDIIRINHIGSSAVEGVLSKPTIDILLEIDGRCDVNQIINKLGGIGYGVMSQEKAPMKWVLNKGYTPSGYADKVFHLHLGYHGDWNELYFRDYLQKHSDIAQEYSNLKMSLMNDYEHNRDGYTEAKSDFVLKYTQIAKQEYRGRYKPK